MDVLRARAFLDLLLGKDSRPRPDARGGETARARPGGPAGEPGRPPTRRAGAVPAGFAGRVTLTVPLATLTGLADRPGELAGLGPVDPWLARDLAAAAAHNPKTTWCVTVTDEEGHAIGHGCARPEPRSHRKRAGPGPPGEAGFSFTPASRDGPPGGYGTWRLRTPGPGPDLIITLDPLTTDPCDHRHESSGHDPGVKLRHLSQVRHATCTSPVCRGPPPSATSSTTPRTRPAAAPACATPARSAATTTGSSSTPSWTRGPAPRRHLPLDHPSRDGPTPPNPPGTPSNN